MLDLGHFPPSQSCDVKIFNNPTPVTNLGWTTYSRPRGKTMLAGIVIGGGGGGGGGFTGIATSARGGGGGGGSSAVTRFVVPLYLLPEIMYVQVGAGGQGVGSGGGTAGSGVLSYLSVYPSTDINNIIAGSGNAAATGGGTGTGAAVGAAGAAGSVIALANQVFCGLGVPEMISGQVGVAGGAVAGANGGNTLFAASSVLTMGGAGGAGTTSADFSGGVCSATGAAALINEAKAAQPAAGSNPGSSGSLLWHPFYSFAGYGGSASNASAGGAGGNGAYGSGGGGGGGGTTGGRGGDGGGGIVILIAW